MNERTAEGAHLLFSLFLIAADLQVILQHPVQRQGDTYYCSRDLLSACIWWDMASPDLVFPLKTLPGKQINYRAKAGLVVHLGWGMRHWTGYGALCCLPDVQLLEIRE